MVLAASGGGGLPSEYQQVEYIGISANGPYLATNYTPIQGDEIECDFKISTNNQGTLFSAGTGSYQTIVLSDITNSTFYLKAFQTGAASALTYFLSTNVRALISLKNPTTTIVRKSDESTRTISTPFQGALDGAATTIWLFRRRNGAAGVPSVMYSFSVVNGGATRLNLIPCYRKSDGVIGMYDTVSGTFYTNAGSGTFIKGADVN